MLCMYVCMYLFVICRFITAEMPPELTELSTAEDTLYFQTVTDNMIHQCSAASNGCLKDGVCKRGYGNVEVRPLTFLDDNGYPTYRRRAKADLKVVPHNRELLVDWNGHMNVEYAGSTYTVLYLYKYLFKGNRKEKARIAALGVTEEEQKDEILMYLRGRIICAMDSMWRFFHFQTYPGANPAVVKINVKLPDHVNLLLQDSKLSKMTVYFARPQILHNYKFTEFYHHFDYTRGPLPKRFTGETLWTEGGQVDFRQDHFCVDLTPKFRTLTYNRQKAYLYSKDPTHEKSIIRMGWLYPNVGDIYYLRLLMYNRPAMSFEEYRTHNAIIHSTFQQSAVAHGYVDDMTEVISAFEHLLLLSTPAELRAFVVTVTIEGFPTMCIMDNEAYVEMLYNDYYHQDPICKNNKVASKNKLLRDLKSRFEFQGKDIMEACGFPMPPAEDHVTEVERHKSKYCVEQQRILYDETNSRYPNTVEQDKVFQSIKNAIDKQETLIVYIQGSAGTGKSTFANKINAYARSKDIIALGCCSTALACQVYGENGEFTTAHDLFGIPVIEDDEDVDHDVDFMSKYFNSHPEKRELLQQAGVIIWDESLSNHKHCLQAAFGITDDFKGKVLILMGDWRQCPPVVKNATMHEIVNASMLNSVLWERVTVVEFTINLRLIKQSTALSDDDDDDDDDNVVRNAAEQFNKEQQMYLNMLDIIGDGRPLTAETSDYVIDMYSDNISDDGSRLLGLPKLQTISDKEAALNWLFPNGFDPDSMHLKAILCSTNAIVDEWNAVIQGLNQNQIFEYRSKDTVDGIDDPNNYLANMINDSVLQRYHQPGVAPNNILRLKVNDICMVMRNINRKDGLVKNLRVKIVALHVNCIRVCTLKPGLSRRYYNIPRIRFTITLPYGRSMKMERKQFPLRLAYCITYNKSQGQEFESALVDIRNNPFMHGHLYVALSRIRISRNIRLFTDPPKEGIDDTTEMDPPTVTNVVYERLKLVVRA